MTALAHQLDISAALVRNGVPVDELRIAWAAVQREEAAQDRYRHTGVRSIALERARDRFCRLSAEAFGFAGDEEEEG